MGHSRYDSLPKTKRWREVVESFSRLESTPQELISATLRAAKRGLSESQNDPFIHSSCWLLLQLPLIARLGKLEEWLEEIGAPSTGDARRDVLGGARRFFDKLSTRTPPQNILSETARLAFLETLSVAFKLSNLVLFGAEKEEVRKSLSRYASPDGYRQLISRFFRAFLKRSLGNFIDKEISNHVGISERFSTQEEAQVFDQELDEYSKESTVLLEDYSHDWYAKNVIHGRAEQATSRAFATYAVKKLLEELERERLQ